MISPAQCRAARTLLSWPVARLAAVAGVSERAVDEFELEQRSEDRATAEALERALAELGVEFLPGDDVRLGVPSQ
jgi:transcriptional regulator with XRE-family HTH domain